MMMLETEYFTQSPFIGGGGSYAQIEVLFKEVMHGTKSWQKTRYFCAKMDEDERLKSHRFTYRDFLLLGNQKFCAVYA